MDRKKKDNAPSSAGSHGFVLYFFTGQTEMIQYRSKVLYTKGGTMQIEAK
jgi:hypothetical protein